MSMVSSYQPNESLAPPPPADAVELSARHLERMLAVDSGAAGLGDRLGGGTVSGLQDRDYPATSGQDALPLRQTVKVTRVPLPPELVEHFGHMACNCSMGLFTQLDRAWLTIDSDIYVWRYEDGGDLAYFDGLSDTILNVALVTPKPGVLQPHIKHLLALSTPVEIVLLGLSLAGEELQLVPEPLFSLPADQLHTSCLVGSPDTGRVWLGGRDGHLYEFCYTAQDGWWAKKTSKVCHSAASLSWLLPGWVGRLGEADPVVQVLPDPSRQVLYTRSETGAITVWDLGSDGLGTERVAGLSAARLAEEAARLAATVEPGNLRPVVALAVVSAAEDPLVHLVAVTAGGARLYLTTSPAAGTAARPATLRLLHVRLPPGFSPSAPPQRPVKVHTGLHRAGLTVLASSPAQAADVLWVVGSGCLPGGPGVAEGQATVQVEGHTWALAEMERETQLERQLALSFGGREPPAAASQHLRSPRRLVALSAQGALLVEVGRPVDCLRQLLLDCGGEGEAVSRYWAVQGGEQAAATALLLATSPAIVDRQLADWATRAILTHGGEPRLLYPAPPAGFLSPGQQSFNPAIMSTPGPGYSSPTSPPYPGQQQPEVQFSARHNGLYLYLSRLLRPVWAAGLLAGGAAGPPRSALSPPELAAIMAQLHDLRSWLEQNCGLCGPGERAGESGASVREKQSLAVLRQLVVDSLQLLGLWSVVVEHTVELVMAKLPEDAAAVLRSAQLRDLVVNPAGRELAGRLVQTLVQTYLEDNASTEAISARLRQLCPGLYRQEDALSSRAHELLLAAAKLSPGGERDKTVGEAVGIAVQIAGHLQLGVLVSHLVACQAHSRVVEVCLAAAAKRDPTQLGVHYYNSGQNSEDSAGLAAFLARTDCYKHCTGVLATLLQAGAAPPASPQVPTSPGPPPPPATATVSPDQAALWAEQVFQLMISSSDQLLHVILYQWLIEHKYIDKLLNIKSAHIEEFLKRGTVQHPETLAMFDLLWKYYEKNSQYVPAGRILSKLADRHSTELDLAGRVQYLSRAIMCVKSSEGGSGGRAAGELLHHLEEKMEVARVQLQVLEAVSANSETAGQVGRLNSDLLDISTLYQDWAEPLQLWECKLAILQCAGHPDQPLVNTIWTRIIQMDSPNRVAALANKMEGLARQYAGSSKYFPLELIVQQLESVSCGQQVDPGWVPACLQAAGVHLPRLLDVYNRLYTNNDPVWLTLGDNLHILKVLSSLLHSFAEDPSLVAGPERRQFQVVCQDAVSTYLGELYMRQSGEASSLVAKFRDIQARLDRM